MAELNLKQIAELAKPSETALIAMLQGAGAKAELV